MSDSTTAPPDGGSTSTTADAAGNTSDGESRLGFLEQEAKKAFQQRDALKAELKELRAREKQMAEAEAERAARAGEYQQAYEALAKEHAELKSRLSDYDATQTFLASSVESAMQELPEDIRATVPEALPAVDRLRLAQSLAKHLSKNKPTSPPVAPTSAPSGGGGAPPPYGTSEYLEWQRTAPMEQVKESRNSWLKRRMTGG